MLRRYEDGWLAAPSARLTRLCIRRPRLAASLPWSPGRRWLERLNGLGYTCFMQQLEKRSTTVVSEGHCAAALIEVVPLVMRALRAEMRRHRSADLSVPQFRVLAFVDRRRGATLSEVAEHIGLTLPSASRMVDGLVARNLLTRGISPSDRRFVALALTAQGRSRLESARRATEVPSGRDAEGTVGGGAAHRLPSDGGPAAGLHAREGAGGRWGRVSRCGLWRRGASPAASAT